MTWIQEHLLLSFRPDWRTPPVWTRRWRLQTACPLQGPESRFLSRPQPRVALSYTLTPLGAAESAALDAALRAALEAFRACCPFWGWGRPASVSPAGLRFGGPDWAWTPGDWVFVAGPAWRCEAFEVLEASRAGPAWQLQLSGPPGGPGPFQAWPVLFGEPSVDLRPAGSAPGAVRVTLTQTGRGLGAPAPAGPA